MKAGKAKYRVLSYQFHCITSDGRSWSGVGCPRGDDRISLGEFLVFALAAGVQGGHVQRLPTTVYLAGHFTRADIPAFSDFKTLQSLMSNVRNTFVSIGNFIPVDVKFGRTPVRIKVHLRDTMLLTPASSKSLAEVGKLVGVPKVSLDPDKKREREIKSNMASLREENWPLFREYALNDAVICAKYLELVGVQYEQLTEKRKIPVTLTSLGVELLQKSWREAGLDDLEILGKEEVKVERWNGPKGCMMPRTDRVTLEEPYFHEAFVTECYHGGRNEQYWFGPGRESRWTDFDLSSAYPTAMSLICKPRWREISQQNRLDDFTPTTLGFATVEFKFPASVRFPTLPVRTANGLVFPSEGRSDCAAPEIALARDLGANLEIVRSVVVATDDDTSVFGDFTKHCIEQRNLYDKGSLNALLWKEIANSTYGKTAQGLRSKRVYDMRDDTMKLLPPKLHIRLPLTWWS